MKKTLILTTASLLLGACSNYSITPAKQIRIGTGVETNSGMPNFYLSEQFVPKKKYIQRSIASTSAVPERDLDEVNNKKVYFLTLLGQYKRLKNVLSNQSEDFKVCPFFHNSLVRQKEYLSTIDNSQASFNRNNYVKAMYTPSTLPLYPELSLPINKKQNVYQYTSQFNNSIRNNNLIEGFVKVALEEHAQKNKKELEELCESGSSDNYYLFENLLTHFSETQNFKSTLGSLKAVLKIPVFANLLLLRSVDSDYVFYAKSQFDQVRRISGKYSIFEEELLARIKMSWMKLYIEKVNEDTRQEVAYSFR